MVLLSVRGWVNLRAVGRLEGLHKSNNLITSSGLETCDLPVCSRATQSSMLPRAFTCIQKVQQSYRILYSDYCICRLLLWSTNFHALIKMCYRNRISKYRAMCSNMLYVCVAQTQELIQQLLQHQSLDSGNTIWWISNWAANITQFQCNRKAALLLLWILVKARWTVEQSPPFVPQFLKYCSVCREKQDQNYKTVYVA
jgi:hypothetical protein